jgi:hypothetical protein
VKTIIALELPLVLDEREEIVTNVPGGMRLKDEAEPLNFIPQVVARRLPSAIDSGPGIPRRNNASSAGGAG